MDPALALAGLLLHPRSYLDRDITDEQRVTMLWPVAVAMAAAAKNLHELAILDELGFRETAYARHVIYGHCDRMPVGMRCDHGHARGPWSVHDWCKPAWALEDGSPEALATEAQCAVGLLRSSAVRGRQHAATPLHAAFAGYAARPWAWPGADQRVRETMHVEARLAALQRP